MNQSQGVGGSYVIGEDGAHTLIDRTKDHPEGNRPRDEPQQAAPAKQPAKPKSAPAAGPATAPKGAK